MGFGGLCPAQSRASCPFYTRPTLPILISTAGAVSVTASHLSFGHKDKRSHKCNRPRPYQEPLPLPPQSSGRSCVSSSPFWLPNTREASARKVTMCHGQQAQGSARGQRVRDNTFFPSKGPGFGTRPGGSEGPMGHSASALPAGWAPFMVTVPLSHRGTELCHQSPGALALLHGSLCSRVSLSELPFPQMSWLNRITPPNPRSQRN